MKVFCLNDAGSLDKMIVYLTDNTMFVSCFNEILYKYSVISTDCKTCNIFWWFFKKLKIKNKSCQHLTGVYKLLGNQQKNHEMLCMTKITYYQVTYI